MEGKNESESTPHRKKYEMTEKETGHTDGNAIGS